VTKRGATFQSKEKKTLLIIAANQPRWSIEERLTSDEMLHLLLSGIFSPLFPLTSPGKELILAIANSTEGR